MKSMASRSKIPKRETGLGHAGLRVKMPLKRSVSLLVKDRPPPYTTHLLDLGTLCEYHGTVRADGRRQSAFERRQSAYQKSY